MNTVTNGWIQCYSVANPHKYWYDILMGFKTELLIAYFLTLVFAVVTLAIISEYRHKKIDDATSHTENLVELNTAQYIAETDRLRHDKTHKKDRT